MNQPLPDQEATSPITRQRVGEKGAVLRLINNADVNLFLWKRPKNELIENEV